MNTKQRRTARRAHMAKFGAQIVELRLFGASPGAMRTYMRPVYNSAEIIRSNLEYQRRTK